MADATDRALDAILKEIAKLSIEIDPNLVREIYGVESKVQYHRDRGDVTTQTARLVRTAARAPELTR